MVLLNNSKDCQEALEKHISDKAALDSCEAKLDDSAPTTLPKNSSTSR